MRTTALGLFTVLTLGLATLPADAATTWPGDSAVTTADATNVFGTNLSGLSFESENVLWAVKNGPSTLYRLVPNGSAWKVAEKRSLRFKNGGGDPDTEGVVWTPDGLFAVAERDNNNGGVSAPTVLKFGTGANATAEWKLTDLPKVAPNEGPESISWVPDSFLTGKGFLDSAGKVYQPSDYPGHGSGLFFVGLETTGTVYAYALQANGFKRVTSFASGLAENMDLEFEASTGRLWATCDSHCNGQATTLAITNGKFAVTATYDRPSKLPNVNLEGFAIAPKCVNGKKTVVWADDDNTGKHALRSGKLNCTS